MNASSPAEYLELDEEAERRSKYFSGQMFPVEAATKNHSDISTNLVLEKSPRCPINARRVLTLIQFREYCLMFLVASRKVKASEFQDISDKRFVSRLPDGESMTEGDMIECP